MEVFSSLGSLIFHPEKSQILLVNLGLSFHSRYPTILALYSESKVLQPVTVLTQIQDLLQSYSLACSLCWALRKLI
jgi:hypothetical protein